MVLSKETTPAGYLASLPPERRAVIDAVRTLVKKRLPAGYVESMNWGMLCYEIPLSRNPITYNKQPLMYIALAAQKNNYAFYMQGVVGFPDARNAIEKAYKAAGRRFDMGGGCLRFKSLDELPMALLGDIVASTSVEQRIAAAAQVSAMSSTGRKSPPKKAGAKSTVSHAVVMKTASKTPAAKKAVAKTSMAKKAATKKISTAKSGTKKQ